MASDAVRRIQQALKNKAFDPGSVDGIWGRNTIAAVRRFQDKQGLEVDGVVGPATSAALFAGAPAISPPSQGAGSPSPVPGGASLLPWYEEARHLMGVKEIKGGGNNPLIMDWATSLDISYQGDDVPWCGLFVAHCVGSTLQQEALPALGARQWERFGSTTTPRIGAVMVFWRESLASGKGHVGFYVGEDDTAYQILGGNQSDMVCLTWLGKDRFRGARWPVAAASLSSGPVRKARTQGLSTNEA